MMTAVKLTVLFKEPFWVGIFEVEERGVYKVSKVTFGAEPKDGEVFEFILNNYFKLNFADLKVINENLKNKKEKKKKKKKKKDNLQLSKLRKRKNIKVTREEKKMKKCLFCVCSDE